MYRFSSGKTPFASTIRSIIVPVFVGPTIYGVSVQESSTTLQEQVDDQQHKKYGTISGVFRPTFMTIVGTFACMMAMFVINPLFGVISIAIVFGVYFYLTRRDIDHEEGDMRSGLFVSLAEWRRVKQQISRNRTSEAGSQTCLCRSRTNGNYAENLD